MPGYNTMSESSLSKAAKKNQKRAQKRAQERAQKLKEEGVIERLKEKNIDPVTELKAQLQEAKTNKDHQLAAKLRKDIWMMQDKLAGQLPPGEELDPLDTVDYEVTRSENDTTNLNDENSPVQTEKKLRKLKKKLQQIENLKSKQDEGEELDKTQIAKIQCEEAVLQDIGKLEELLKQQTDQLATV